MLGILGCAEPWFDVEVKYHHRGYNRPTYEHDLKPFSEGRELQIALPYHYH